MYSVKERESITVDGVVEWAGRNGIDLGKNPRRTLIYLASNDVIPKTIKGPNCKGVYNKAEVFSRLSFYHSRKQEGWRIQDIAVAVARLGEAKADSAELNIPLMDMLNFQTEESFLALPLADFFKTAFREYIKRNPGGAENLIQYLDEQESLTGVKIGQAFRKLVGVELLRRTTETQTRIDF